MESRSLRSSISVSSGIGGDVMNSSMLWSILQDLVAHRRTASSIPTFFEGERFLERFGLTTLLR
jgi:hypothetical protein